MKLFENNEALIKFIDFSVIKFAVMILLANHWAHFDEHKLTMTTVFSILIALMTTVKLQKQSS